MNATRGSTLLPFARAGLILATVAAGMLVLTSIPAAATVIGSATGTTACNGGQDLVQLASTSASYAAPAGGGTITSWSTQAGTDTGPAALLVWRPTATAGTFMLVAESPLVTLTPSAMNTFILAAPISVQAGDLLGLHTQGRIECIAAAAAGNTIGYHIGATAAVGGQEALLTDPLALTLNVSATVGTPTPPTPVGGGTTSSGSGEKEESGDRHESGDDQADQVGHRNHHSHPAKPETDDGNQKQHTSSADSEQHTGDSAAEKGDLFKPDL